MTRNNRHLSASADAIKPVSQLPDPVLIVGMHNSGTSILAEIIHEAGVFMCPDIGHFESSYFSHFLNDDLVLGSIDRWAQLPLPTEEAIAEKFSNLDELTTNGWLSTYIKAGYDGSSPWGIKDPRLCLMLTEYHRLFPESKVVYIHRDSRDVAASLTQRPKKGVGFNRDFESWHQLTLEYQGRAESGLDRFTAGAHRLTYEDLCANPNETVQLLMQFLGLGDKPLPGAVSKVSRNSVGSFDRIAARGLGSKVRSSIDRPKYYLKEIVRERLR